jgi:hypothetical protein
MTGGAGAEGVSFEEIIARLLGTTVEEMREHPEAAREKLAAFMRGLAQAGAGGEGRSDPEAVREFVRRLRVEFRERGVELPEEVEAIPDRLQEFYALLEGSTPEELAERLRGIAGLLESPGEQGVELEDVAAWLEKTLGPLVGSERARSRRQERLQAEYREAARRSIAASLRKFGIEPLDTGEDDVPAPRARMNRHRLFWKEFAASASEIKSLLAGGEDEAARKRVADLLEAFDLNLPFDLSLEGEDADAVLTFPPPDDAEAAVRLQTVIRDRPALQGWRVVRGRRYGTVQP